MDWIVISFEQIIGIALSALVVYVLLLIFVRINGLRSLSKMSAHDFAVTIAIGSILATTVIQKEPSALQGAVSIGILLFLQSMYSLWRLGQKSSPLENNPLLIVDNGEILHENLKKSRITENDLMSKLREANVHQMSEIQAVIFEATGDISVLHSSEKKKIDDKILKDVQR